ncbi:MAG: 16S rRNA (cytidine(1402)-2'-O)-methyltransferase [Pseudomonadota bacterium]
MAELQPESGLHLVATPIGRLRDITLHALDLLQAADLLVAEDTRVLQKLMMLHAVPVQGRKFLSYHDHSNDIQARKIAELGASGDVVVYCSDAGTPAVSDPGYKLVQAALETGCPVWSAPGPSAMLAALVQSGLPSDRFRFEGFLPARPAARRSVLEGVRETTETVIFYDTPKRIRATISDLAVTQVANRTIVICRELTKKHEEVLRSTIGVLADAVSEDRFNMVEKGEIVLLLGPVPNLEVNDEIIREKLTELVDDPGVKRASNRVADMLGVQKSRVYKIALSLRDKG